MTKLTTTECATLAGVNSRTIQRKIKAGELSATKDNDGNYLIDASEFYRVYPNATVDDKKPKKGETSDNIELVKCRAENEWLNDKCRILSDKIDLLEKIIDDYKTRESKHLEMASSIAKLLEHDKTKKKRWFGRN